MNTFQTALKTGLQYTTRQEATEQVNTVAKTGQEREAHSMSMGFGIAFCLLSIGFVQDDIDTAFFRQAFEAALQGKITEDEVRAYDESMDRMRQIIRNREATAARANLAITKAFLKENSGKPGIVTMPDGLQYKIEKQGTGRTYDAEKDGEYPVYVVKFTMSDIHGNIWDDYTKAPTELMGPVSPEGLDTALSIMPIGSTWTLFLSPELGFGEETSQDERISIPGNSVLVIRVELLDIHALDIPKVIPLKTDNTEPDGSDNETSGNHDE
ncbi:FKBP-type peptidyl-prolyl cis-trans isomerase N-terminal domain-containing protein [Akkermansia glycaniphila]|nr:FKBP-type peptidyl-prolyl cis-trans isomerase N-terminal domain-containing protein [Akkermansia glycaniphila]MBT9449154.1 FKBP-type peptidyl-prolyl cis-trans isomerase [Akkermansia glycaniphila]